MISTMEKNTQDERDGRVYSLLWVAKENLSEVQHLSRAQKKIGNKP